MNPQLERCKSDIGPSFKRLFVLLWTTGCLACAADAASEATSIPDSSEASSTNETALDSQADASSGDGLQAGPTGLADGLAFGSVGEKLQLKAGAYLFLDYAHIDQNKFFDYEFGSGGSDSEARQARISLRGNLYRSLQFKFEVALEGDEVEAKDLILSRGGIPYLGELQFGQLKEPFGLEQSQSSHHRLFMEPSLVNSLTPGRNVGIKASNACLNNRLTWSAGFFTDTDTFDTAADSDALAATVRVTGLPLYHEDRNELLHLGAAFSYRDDISEASYTVRPESNLAPEYLKTGTMDLSAQTLLGLEAAYQRGPFLLQGECLRVWLHDVEYDHDVELENRTITVTRDTGLEFDAAYAQVSYILTGERREYNPERGIFRTVTPERPLGWNKPRGPGAWEIAARVSQIDMKDKFVNGGRETNYTLGLNWYLNPSVRMMFNYIRADVDVDVDLPNLGATVHVDEDVDIFQMRVQFDFAPKEIIKLRPSLRRGKRKHESGG